MQRLDGTTITKAVCDESIVNVVYSSFLDRLFCLTAVTGKIMMSPASRMPCDELGQLLLHRAQLLGGAA